MMSFGTPGYTADYAYWKEKGWFSPEAKYYVDMPVNPVYNAVGWIAEHMPKKCEKKWLKSENKSFLKSVVNFH